MVRSAIPAMVPAGVFAFVPSARAEYEGRGRCTRKDRAPGTPAAPAMHRSNGRSGDAPVERRAGVGAGDP